MFQITFQKMFQRTVQSIAWRSGEKFKEATEENPHEQQDVKGLSTTEFKRDFEEKQSVPRIFKQFDRADLKEDIEEKQSVPQDVKQLNSAAFKEDTEEKQSVPQNIKQLNRAAFKEDTEEKQSVPQIIKKLNRAAFKEDNEEKQSVPQNVKPFDRAEFKEDIEENQSVVQNVKQFNVDTFKENKKQNVQELVKQFERAQLQEDIEGNPNEHQNLLHGNPKEKRTKETQSRLSQSSRFPKCCWYGLLINIINTILLCILILIVSIYVSTVKNCDLNSPAQSRSSCPHYWIGYEGKCYFFSRERLNWTSSQNFCSSHNSYLTRIESEEDKDFVMILKGKGIYWIGLQRHPGQPWTWTNGENSRLEVIEGGGNCAYLNNEAKAVSSGCHKILPWICSRSASYT